MVSNYYRTDTYSYLLQKTCQVSLCFINTVVLCWFRVEHHQSDESKMITFLLAELFLLFEEFALEERLMPALSFDSFTTVSALGLRPDGIFGRGLLVTIIYTYWLYFVTF